MNPRRRDRAHPALPSRLLRGEAAKPEADGRQVEPPVAGVRPFGKMHKGAR